MLLIIVTEVYLPLNTPRYLELAPIERCLHPELGRQTRHFTCYEAQIVKPGLEFSFDEEAVTVSIFEKVDFERRFAVSAPGDDTEIVSWDVAERITPETTHLIRANTSFGRRFIFPFSSYEAAQAEVGQLREEGYIDFAIDTYHSGEPSTLPESGQV